MDVNCISGGACHPIMVGGRIGLDRGPADLEPGGEPIIPDFSSRPFEIFCGDALETIRSLRAGGTSFDCVITSPPYLGQRRYGHDPREIGRAKGKGGVRSYVSALVDIFKAIPLRPWGSIWVNLGDKRAANTALLAVPHLFVLGMLEAGFFLKDAVVWAKEVATVEGTSIGHCQVEPAKGRLNGNAWEPFYRFVKDPRHSWSDTSAVRIPRDPERFFHKGTTDPIGQHPYSRRMTCATSLEGRCLPNVWYVGNSRKGEDHHAAFPRELVERVVAMSCPEHLVDDGGQARPRERKVQATEYSEGPGKFITVYGQLSCWQGPHHHGNAGEEGSASLATLRDRSGRNDTARRYVPRYPRTLGWTHMDKAVTGPGIVLDPFAGTGTTGEAAILLGRRFVGIDLYQDNADRMNRRCEAAFEMLQRTRGSSQSTQ